MNWRWRTVRKQRKQLQRIRLEVRGECERLRALLKEPSTPHIGLCIAPRETIMTIRLETCIFPWLALPPTNKKDSIKIARSYSNTARHDGEGKGKRRWSLGHGSQYGHVVKRVHRLVSALTPLNIARNLCDVERCIRSFSNSPKIGL